MKSEMPETVKRVHTAMVRSARAAGQSDDSVYTGFQPVGSMGPPYEWAVGDNCERLDGSLVYNTCTEQWVWRDKWSGEDTPIENGEAEAIANAEIMYTG